MEPLGLLALVAILRVVAGDEIIQVGTAQRVGLQGEIPVRAKIIDPQCSGPGGRAGRLLIKKDDVRLHPLLVKNTCWESQQGMHIEILQQSLADHLACAALEQHIIRHNNGCPAMDREDGFDVLEEIELLVTRADPEIIAHDNISLAFLSPLLVDIGDAAFLAKGRIREHHFETLARVAAQAISHVDGDRAFFVAANTMQEEIHHTQARRIVYNLPAAQGLVSQEILLIPVKGILLRDILVSS